MKPREIALHRLRVPLRTPYRLAFGPVEHYDTIIVRIADDHDAIGWGEATVLTGYTDETIDDSWRVARELAAAMVTLDRVEALPRLLTVGASYPFTATAFGTALEMAAGSPLLRVAERTRVPLLGLLQGDDEAALAASFDALQRDGFGTVKVKIGFDVEQDLAHVRMVQAVVAGRARIRLDANQGYSAEEGIAFVRALDPAGIELFEQPCAAHDWDAHLAVVRAATVPMMLDESIYGLDDIDRAAELAAAKYVKLKLMKMVTLERLLHGIERIRRLGMQPVLGNGVACDVGCWMEACIAARCIDTAGEMNGFLKIARGLLNSPLPFERGAIVLTPDLRPEVDADALARYAVASETFTARMRVN